MIKIIDNCKIENNIEIIERKGLGHPDTLCDLIAETFSNNYSKYCIKEFGNVLNHWVDKVVLSGGVVELDFGYSRIKKPITVYLFGKVIEKIGNNKIDIENIFQNSVKEVFSKFF
jgi:S-adenosylmethionine synthetase